MGTTLLVAYFWQPPTPSLAVNDIGDFLGLLIFFVVVRGVISGLSGARRRTTAALASELETPRAFFESAAEGIVIVSQTGRSVRVNADALVH